MQTRGHVIKRTDKEKGEEEGGGRGRGRGGGQVMRLEGENRGMCFSNISLVLCHHGDSDTRILHYKHKVQVMNHHVSISHCNPALEELNTHLCLSACVWDCVRACEC